MTGTLCSFFIHTIPNLRCRPHLPPVHLTCWHLLASAARLHCPPPLPTNVHCSATPLNLTTMNVVRCLCCNFSLATCQCGADSPTWPVVRLGQPIRVPHVQPCGHEPHKNAHGPDQPSGGLAVLLNAACWVSISKSWAAGFAPLSSCGMRVKSPKASFQMPRGTRMAHNFRAMVSCNLQVCTASSSDDSSR